MKNTRQLSIVAYGIIVSIIGLVLYIGLTVLATNQLDNLRLTYENKHQASAKLELKMAIKKLAAETEQLVKDFYNWEELLQQINDPTYYAYWRENRVASVNFVPPYFKNITLFNKNGKSLESSSTDLRQHFINAEHEKIIVRSDSGKTVIERCRSIKEMFGAKNTLGYFCLELDFFQGLSSVQKYSYLDITSLEINEMTKDKVSFNDLIQYINFSVQSEQALTKMYDLTATTVLRYLMVSAGLMIIFLYILAIPVARPLRGLSSHINTLKDLGSRHPPIQPLGLVSILELDKVYKSLSDYQERLEKSALELTISEEHFRSLIENSSDVIMLINSDGIIIYISPSVVGMLGYEVSEVVGNNLFEYIHENDRKSLRSSISQSDNPASNEFRFKHEKGEWLTLESAGEIFFDDDGTCTLNCRDVTERKKAEEAISIAHNSALEASEAKSNFLANTSHELRTPLNAILGYSEIIMEDIQDDHFENIEKDINKVHVAAGNLLQLIDKVLDLAKIESGKIELFVEKFSVSALLDEVEHTASPLIDKNLNSFKIKVADNIDVICTDKIKLRQIILNLINNAAKFTYNGKLTLDVMSRNENGRAWVDFIFTDTGIGMTSEQLDKIFEPFIQADASTTRKYGGTGLGLTICKSFADVMNGSIDVQSKEGVGSTFTLTLPEIIRGSEEKPPQ